MSTMLAFQLLSQHGSAIPSATPNTATGTGASFNHIVIIAMENQYYSTVLGSGTGASCCKFLASLLPYGATIPNFHSYGANDFSGDSISGCSAACYTAETSGATYGVSDGVSSGSVSAANIFDRLTGAGLTWKGFCEDSCPRNADHFPPLQYADTYQSTCSTATSENCFLYTCNSCATTTISDSQLVSELNSASPASYIWFTPTDDHNMHDVSPSTGDAYLQQILVGTGTVSNPSPGSILSTSLFASGQTLLYIWWDEYDPSPNLLYEPGVVYKGFVSTANIYDEYASLHTIENNWNLPTLNYDGKAPLMSDIFGTTTSSALSASFTYSPSAPSQGTSVTFIGSATGGTASYTYAWNFGDGSTSSIANPTHTYTTQGTYTVSLAVTDSAKNQAKTSQTIIVSPPPTFAITTGEKSVSMMQTFSQNVTLTVASLYGFTGTIQLTATANGTGVTTKLAESSITLGVGAVLNTTLTIRTTNSTLLGNYAVSVTAANGALSQSLTIALRVNILGDLDEEGVVGLDDISIMAFHYGATETSPNWYPLADLNHDGVIGLVDFELAAANFDKTPTA